jgi:hypothetical protein
MADAADELIREALGAAPSKESAAPRPPARNDKTLGQRRNRRTGK